MFGIKITFSKDSPFSELVKDTATLSGLMAHESKRVYHRHQVRKLSNSIAKLEELDNPDTEESVKQSIMAIEDKEHRNIMLELLKKASV